MPVRNMMKRKVWVIKPTDTLTLAYDTMIDHVVRHLPVVENGQLVGLISDRDLLLAAKNSSAEGFSLDQDVKSIMSEQVHSCQPGTPVKEAAKYMTEHMIHALPVINDDNKIIGIITSSDLLHFVEEPKQVKDMDPAIWFEL